LINQATTETKKEVDTLKKIIFLIIASLLVIGLVVPGCEGEGPPPPEELVWNFGDDGEIVIGIAGEVDHPTGDMAFLGASLAVGAINGAGGVDIDGTAFNVTLQKIDTQEATDETGASGTAAMTAAIDSVDFVMGGFRTEALSVYREVAMTAEKMFFDCGAATSILSESVVDDYDTYRYWMKTTPPNEYFLADGVLKQIGFAAEQIRAALNLTPDANLDACILAEDLVWSRDELVPKLEAGLPGLDITNEQTYLVSSLDPASTVGALADIAANYDPHIIIPIYSGTMGVYFAGTLLTYVGADTLGPMPVGINVMAQLKQPWATGLNSTDPGDGMYVAFSLFLDTWAEECAQTPMSLPFLSAFMTYAGGEYPLYTAATYDATFGIKACLEEAGYMEGGEGKVAADDFIAWYEDPANAQMTAIGSAVSFYPQAGTEVGGEPALSEAQVNALYNPSSYGYTYDVNDWLMPPHNTHDLAYGPPFGITFLGCQWQFDVGDMVWKKFAVWPASGFGAVDQYGDWDMEYTGTKPFQLPSWIVPHFTS
jgi:branched-chain amino acid transport system substrate-binding protein